MAEGEDVTGSDGQGTEAGDGGAPLLAAGRIVIPPDKRDANGRFLPGVPRAMEWTPELASQAGRVGNVVKATKRELMAQKLDARVLKAAAAADPSIEDHDDAWAALGEVAYVASKATFESAGSEKARGGELREAVAAGRFALEMADRAAERGRDAGAQAPNIVIQVNGDVYAAMLARKAKDA